MIEKEQESLYDYFLVLEFFSSVTDPIGWYGFTIFSEGKLNSEPFNVPLFRGFSPEMPISFQGIKKIKTKVQFRLSYSEPSEEADENLDPLQKLSQNTSKLGSRKQIAIQDERVPKLNVIAVNGIEVRSVCAN